MPMPQYNGPVYSQGPTAVGPELRSQVNALNLSASQSNQNAYLVAQLKTPAPVPAYTVPNPNGYYGGQQNCYQSCGC